MLKRLKEFLGPLATSSPDELSDQHALQLATAVLLVEVMRSDAEITHSEQSAVLTILQQHFGLNAHEVGQLLDLADRTARDSYDFHRFTSLLNSELDQEEKVRVIEYMWQVAYADEHLSAHENHLLRKIAALLYISHADYVAAKMRAGGNASQD